MEWVKNEQCTLIKNQIIKEYFKIVHLKHSYK